MKVPSSLSNGNDTKRRIVMKQIIVASSGFGALAARALANTGHTVYASMREITTRNAAQVEAAKKYASDNNVDLRTVELDVALRSRLTKLSSKSLPTTGVSMSSSITPDTWSLVPRKPSPPNNWRTSTM